MREKLSSVDLYNRNLISATEFIADLQRQLAEMTDLAKRLRGMVEIAHPIARGSRTGRVGIALACKAFLDKYTDIRRDWQLLDDTEHLKKKK
jgi:hypothetical protein